MRGAGAFVLLLAGWTAARAQAPGPPGEDRAEVLRRARVQAASGKSTEAKGSYAAVLAGQATAQQEIEAHLGILALLLAADANDPSRAAEIEDHYVKAIRAGEGVSDPKVREDVLRAQNNYAAFLMAHGRAQDARAKLREMGPAMDEAANARFKPRYLHNAAQAAESVGDTQEALRLYQQAVALDPVFAPAVRGASRLTLAAPSESIGIPSTVTLVTDLLRSGNLPAAAAHMKEACASQHWVSDQQYGSLVFSLADYFIAAETDRATFQSEWVDILKRARGWAGGHGAARIDGLIRLYEADLPPRGMSAMDCADFGAWCHPAPGDPPPPAREREREWALPPAASAAVRLSRLAKIVGDDRLRTNDPKGALARYALAWSVDPESSEAGLYLANLLIERRAELDPDGTMLDRFIRELLSGKNQAYLGEDWPNVLRLHTLLGTIFEKKGQWGPPDQVETAVFQWEHALRTHTKLRETGQSTDLKVVPGLHQKLAVAYSRLGRESDARDQHLEAVQGFIALGQVDLAARSLEKARNLSLAPTPSQLDLMRALEHRLKSAGE